MNGILDFFDGLGLRVQDRGSGSDYDELVQASLQKTQGLRLDSTAKAAVAQAAQDRDLYQEALGSLILNATHGSLIPSVRVQFSNLTIEAKGELAGQDNPSVLNSAVNTLPIKKFITNLNSKKSKDTRFFRVLDNATGILEPGRLTLLLGPPGSGKSLLQSALAGRLKPQKGSLNIQGAVTYNGIDVSTLESGRIVGWVRQRDVHLPKLSVLETTKFAMDCLLDPALQHRILSALLVGGGDSDASVGVDNKVGSKHLETASVALADDDVFEELVSKLSKSKSAGLAALESGQASRIEEEKGGGGGRESSKLPGILDNFGIDNEQRDILIQLIVHNLQARMVLSMLGLDHVAKTYIGDAMVRGISGGQRRRVTLAEELAGTRDVLIMDEINTGLDSASTYSIACTLSNIAKHLQKVVLVSMLQPQAEAFEKFDDVILLMEGKIVYHGPVGHVVNHFTTDLGWFVFPKRKDPASFLLELCTPTGQLVHAGPALLEKKGLTVQDQDVDRMLENPPTTFLVTADEMVEAFNNKKERGSRSSSDIPEQKKSSETITPTSTCTRTNPTTTQDGDAIWPPKRPFARSLTKMTSLVLNRQLKLDLRERSILIIRFIQILLLGFIYGTLFTITTNLASGRNVLSLCTTTILGMSFLAVPQISIVFSTKPIFFKHRDGRFFHVFSYVIASITPQWGMAVYETILFSLFVYWISGFYASAGYFFTFVLILWSSLVTLTSQYRLVAYTAPSLVASSGTASFIMLLAIITNGFTIVKYNIPSYIIWIYWINPVSWAIRSLAISELTSPDWKVPVNSTTTTTMGQYTLEQYGFYTETAWIWYGLAFLWGSTVVYTACSVVALKWRDPPVPRPVITRRDGLKGIAMQALKDAETRKSMKFMKKVGGVEEKEEEEEGNDGGGDIGGWRRGMRGKVGMRIKEMATLDTTASAITNNNSNDNNNNDNNSKTPPLVTLVCKDIWYKVPHPQKKGEQLPLIKGVSFYAKPGTLTALMGGSGAGKTTLMDCILSRKTQGEITGDILVNGLPATPAVWSGISGYVEQFDNLTAQLTVQETVQFSGRLRLDETLFTAAQVKQAAHAAISMVELETVVNRVVGSVFAPSLSAEQCKRVSIAVELVANPAVLFCDEVTSGLDVRAAGVVMRAVKNVAKSGRTIVATIHQPSIEIFESFDRLLLLRKGGLVDYFGDIGVESVDLIEYFERFPGVAAIQPGYNPASWMLEVTGAATSTVFTSAALDFSEEYTKGELYKENEETIAAFIEEGTKEDHNDNADGNGNGGRQSLAAMVKTSTGNDKEIKSATSSNTQRTELLKKYWLIYWRSPSYNYIRILMTLAIALVYGLIFLNKGNLGATADVATIQGIAGVVFSMSNFLGIFNTLNVQPIVSQERAVYYRERAIGMYGPGAVAIVSGLVEVPYLLTQGLIMSVVAYWMIGFEAIAWKFFYFFLLFTLSITMSCFLGQFLVYATPSPVLAQLLATTMTQLFVLFCGFLSLYPTMPEGWKWMNRIVPTTWTMYGLMTSQIGDSNVLMAPGSSTDPDVKTVSEYVEWLFGYEYSFIWWCPLIMLGYCVFLRVAIAVVLKHVSFLKR